MPRLNTWLFAGAALVLACIAIIMSLNARAHGAPLSNACYGYCPIYKVSIHADGRVAYHGERFVKRKGDATGQLTAAQLASVRAAFVRIDYFKLAASYDHPQITDAPGAITSFTDGGHTKTVPHNQGDGTAPAELGKLEDQIDQIVGVAQWIGTDKEREAHRSEWR
jgi:hypothetical protein